MLTQKGTQRIEVIVRKETNGANVVGAKEKDIDEVSSSGNTNSNKPSYTKTQNATKRFVLVNTTHTYAVSKQLLRSSMNFAIQGLQYKTGDQSYQDLVNRQLEIITDAGNVTSGLFMGVTYGATGGPVGMLIGGMLGMASSLIPIAFKYADRDREFNYKQFLENNEIEYKRARASINMTTGRLR